MSLTKILVLIATTTMISLNAQAKDNEEARHLLRAALAESNGDYNKHKEKSNTEEFDRAEEWSSRDNGAIFIEGSSQDAATTEEFQELSQNYEAGEREVSSYFETGDEEETQID